VKRTAAPVNPRIHHMHPRLIDGAHVRVVGCGGSGSQMLTGLARLNQSLIALGRPGIRVVAHDPDAVSPANIARQLFAPADVGHNKAVVLINRLNAYFGTNWYAEPNEFRRGDGRTDILITCVDTRAARRWIDYSVTTPGGMAGSCCPVYWMDLGNRAEDGQVILGQPASNKKWRNNKTRLPTVTELLPEIIKHGREDNAPSCSLAAALEKQHLFVNQAVATCALQILWQLLRTGQIDWHGAFINLRTGRTAPLAVDPDAWERMRGSSKASPTRKAKP
jgi:PRTRC genetic system ThiF family protein